MIYKSKPTKQQPIRHKRAKPVNIVPTNSTHIRVRRLKTGDCAQYKKGMKRIALKVIDGNKRHAKRSQYGYKVYDITLYKDRSCFNDFHVQLLV